MKVEFDTENPSDVAMVWAVLRTLAGEPQPDAVSADPPGQVATDDLIAGRDTLLHWIRQWEEGGAGGPDLAAAFRAPDVLTYIDACGGLLAAAEAVLSGSAGLTPPRLAAIQTLAKRFAEHLRHSTIKGNFPVPPNWRLS